MKVQAIKDLSRSTHDLTVVVVEKEPATKGKAKKGAPAGVHAQHGGWLETHGFEGKEGQTVLAPPVDGGKSTLYIGASPSKARGRFEEIEFRRRVGATVAAHARTLKAKSVAVSGGALDLAKDEFLIALVEGIELAQYEFTRYRSKQEQRSSIHSLAVVADKAPSARAIREAELMSEATRYARDLINIGPSDLPPRELLEAARKLAKENGLKIEVYDKRRLEQMGAGAILGIARGSEEPPYIIKLTYRPKSKPKKVVALVGKGVTFDTGGLSIKPAASMETMKDDMGGAAAVLGAMRVVAELGSNVEVRAYIPTVENMINGVALKPGDVVKAMNGKTIEVLNTDAEGRVIMADAFSLAHKDGCDELIDIATLTGACHVALGSDYAGLFTDDEALLAGLMQASEQSGERLWRLPIAEEYKPLVKSSVADIKNTGGRHGGAITAALILREFVKPETKWAHLDIAGPAWSERDHGYIKKGGVGFGVRTLARYLLAHR